MVLRSTRPRGIAGVVRDQADRTDDLARRQGRGAQALRNRAGHILELNPASPNPLVTPQGTDSGLRFQDGRLVITDGDGENTRDLTIRSMQTAELLVTNNAIKCIPYDGAIRFSSTDGALEVANRDGTALRGVRCNRLHTNDVDSNGDINALGGIRAEGGLSSGGDCVIGGVFTSNTRSRSPNWSSSVYDGAIRWNPNGAVECVNYAGTAYRGIYATNFAPPPSWRAIKRDFATVREQLGQSARDTVDALDVRFHRYDPAKVPEAWDTDELRLGPMLDEVPAELRATNVAEDGTDRSSYDVVKLLGLALAAYQELSAEVRDLRAQLDARPAT